MGLVGQSPCTAADWGAKVDNREVGFYNSPKGCQTLDSPFCKGLVLAPNHRFGLTMFKTSVSEFGDDFVERVQEEGTGDRVRFFADFKDEIVNEASEVQCLRHVSFVHLLTYRVQDDARQVAAGAASSHDARAREDRVTDPAINP